MTIQVKHTTSVQAADDSSKSVNAADWNADHYISGAVSVGAFDALSAAVSTVAANVSTLSVSVSVVRANVSTLSVEVSTVRAGVSTLSVEVSVVRANVSALSVEVSTVRANVSSLSVYASAISAAVSTVAANVSALSVQVSTLSAQHSTLSVLHSTLSALHSALSAQHTTLSAQVSANSVITSQVSAAVSVVAAGLSTLSVQVSQLSAQMTSLMASKVGPVANAQVLSTSALVDVSGMAFSVGAGNTYAFKYYIVYQVASTTTGLGLTVTFPGMRNFAANVEIPSGAVGTANKFCGQITASGTRIQSLSVQAGGTNYYAIVEGVCGVSTSGTIQLRAAIDASGNSVQGTIVSGTAGAIWQLG